MSKLFSLILVTGLLTATPSFADKPVPGDDAIHHSCTLNPFNHTQSCTRCVKNSKGEEICTVVVTSTRKLY
jgi:hypothetical protein